MKKFIATLLALVLALLPLSVFAEDEAYAPSPEADELMDSAILSGFVMDVQDEFLLIRTPDGLYVEALLSPETVFEGKSAVIGDFVHIAYNGMMTRSLPAQINAQSVACHMLQGVVSDLTEAGFTLTFGEDVYHINAEPALLATIQDGMFVTVFHSGMMTMSLPPQLSADHVRGQELVGTVTEMMENGFTLTVDGEELPYAVFPKEDALLFVQPEPGMELIVITDGLMTAGLDQITVNATEIIPLPVVEELFDIAGVVTEITEEFILIGTADGQQVQVNLFEGTIMEGKEIEADDFVHVTYNGMMTFSIPAQITAMKIGCYAHTGTVSDLGEDGFILNTELEPIYVSAPAELLTGIENGMTITVYSNGAMTMSLPARIGAEMITATETIAD
ncbi:MAG: hypothetical protein E7327_06830 [Clostridiales bacterium]|nr:hypothetical protein [Clostridiales bacterium]